MKSNTVQTQSFLGKSIETFTLLTLILASSPILTILKSTHLYNLLARLHRSSLSPCLKSNSHLAIAPKGCSRRFECKINGQAFGASLQHTFGRPDRQAQNRVFSGCKQLLLATTSLLISEILTQSMRLLIFGSDLEFFQVS